jgi:hypothetical protein
VVKKREEKEETEGKEEKEVKTEEETDKEDNQEKVVKIDQDVTIKKKEEVKEEEEEIIAIDLHKSPQIHNNIKVEFFEIYHLREGVKPILRILIPLSPPLIVFELTATLDTYSSRFSLIWAANIYLFIDGPLL